MLAVRAYGLLVGNAAVVARFGTRIYPNRAEKLDPKPYLVYSIASDQRVNTLGGESVGYKRGLVQMSICVDEYAYTSGQTAADEVNTALVPKTEEQIWEWQRQGLAVSQSDRRDFYDRETKTHTVVLTFSIEVMG